MNFNATIKTLDVDDITLRTHLQSAEIPTLLMTVAHLSQDMSVLKDAWRPALDFGVVVSRMSESQEREARELCRRKLTEFRDRRMQAPSKPTYDQLHQMATWLIGPQIEPFLPLVSEELVTNDEDLRRPRWTKQQIAPDRNFQIAIVGAGESGLVAALRLKQAGVPFVIYEKNHEVGGTWLENTYPGCRVDINSFFYSYSFARKIWSDYFSTSQDVLGYLKEVAREYGLYEHIQFNTEVAAMNWDDSRCAWDLTLRTGAKEHTSQSNVVVSAVGQLNRPSMPNIPGQKDFKGVSFHSARWNHAIDLTGKRVGIIGTGASATQFIPQVAKKAAQVTVFARTTNWLLPTPDLHDKVSNSTQWLHENVPHYSMWYRASLVLPQSIGVLDAVMVDPEFPPTEKAVSAQNDQLRDLITKWMEPQFADRPDLRDLLIPDSPVGGKRIVRDNGTWIATLKRDNVRVERSNIDAITGHGISCANGVDHEFDVIIYGTGFEAAKFLMPMKVTGRDGIDLHATWDGDARAYMGATVPGFPNLFCMYGPNTNLVVYGTIILFSELTAKYIVDAARLLLETGHDAIDVREDVFDRFNERVDDANAQRAWGFSKVNSWYKNSKGRVAQNFPFNAVEFWRRTHEVVATDYHFVDAESRQTVPVDLESKEAA
jgi:4-hydroxyacetophenone monooxygenase